MQSPCGRREHSILEELDGRQLRREEDKGWRERTRVAPVVAVAGEVCSSQTLWALLRRREPRGATEGFRKGEDRFRSVP